MSLGSQDSGDCYLAVVRPSEEMLPRSPTTTKWLLLLSTAAATVVIVTVRMRDFGEENGWTDDGWDHP